MSEDLARERMMARRHALTEDVGKVTGMKKHLPPPDVERNYTREDVLCVLAQRLNDVRSSKSDTEKSG